MNVRRATRDDLDAIRGHWEAREGEIGGPPWVRETWEEELVDVERRLRDSAIFLAEDDGQPLGLLGLDFGREKIATAQASSVGPERRRAGAATALRPKALPCRASTATTT